MKKKINQAKILSAAIKIADDKGLLNLSINELAAELDIKSPSLYNHISGLDDLYQELALLALRQLEQVLLKAAVGQEKAAALRSTAQAYFGFATAHPALYQAIENPKLAETDEISAGKAQILKILQQLLSSYQLEKTQELHIIRVLRSYLHGFILLNQGQLFKMNVEMKRSFSLGLEAILQGFDLQ